MTDEKFSQILRAQTPDAEKQELADYVLPTAYGKMVTGWYIDQMITDILLRETRDA